MNNNQLNELTALLQFRLRAARHKKRAQYDDWDKQLLALERERNALYQQRRSIITTARVSEKRIESCIGKMKNYFRNTALPGRVNRYAGKRFYSGHYEKK